MEDPNCVYIGRFTRVPDSSEHCRPMSISVLSHKLSADIRKPGPGWSIFDYFQCTSGLTLPFSYRSWVLKLQASSSVPTTFLFLVNFAIPSISSRLTTPWIENSPPISHTAR
jgi:hypothetical protein